MIREYENGLHELIDQRSPLSFRCFPPQPVHVELSQDRSDRSSAVAPPSLGAVFAEERLIVPDQR